MKNFLFGVSPAYFLSAYGQDFTPADVCAALPGIRRLGFGAFQAEIFASEKLDIWLSGGAAAVKAAALDSGLCVSAVVAHFALPSFADAEALADTGEGGGLPELEKMFEIAASLRAGQLASIPLGPYAGVRDAATAAAFRNKLGAAAALGRRYGLPVALEVQPGAFVSGPDEVAALVEDLGIGFNLDTGHTFAAGFDPCVYAPRLQGRILATHLCDNDGRENLSLRPGRGGIDFPRLVKSLRDNGYAGSYDLEIFCPTGEVEREYADGLALLKRWLDAP